MRLTVPPLDAPTVPADGWLILRSDERGQRTYEWTGGDVCRLDGETLRDGDYGGLADGVLTLGPFKVRLVAFDWSSDTYYAERVA